ncbi:hypothetical protein ScalyP_jg7740 [Parmales sp. scaly parma]|nr:hypothetical protein ScalyP_jg7740 [Parmales sp. scaly parma]
MLAPRKTLWSTPTPAITTAATFTSPQKSDTLYDVGCGDARVLIALATSTPCENFVGIEIDPNRALEARQNVAEARKNKNVADANTQQSIDSIDSIDVDTAIDIKCENAMGVDYSPATIVFLYLVPRGLRLIRPLLLAGLRKRLLAGDGSATMKVVTYMAGFVDEEHKEMVRVEVEHQKGSGWPVFYYVFGREEVERWEEESRILEAKRDALRVARLAQD